VERFYFLETTLVITGGLYTSPVGNLDLLIWLQASNAGAAGDEARGHVVRNARDNKISAQSFAAPICEIEHLLQSLRELQFPGRAPRVEGVVDSSDGWTNISLHVRDFEREGSFTLGMASSGYQGEDAERLERVLNGILTAAGLDPQEFQYVLNVNQSDV